MEITLEVLYQELAKVNHRIDGLDHRMDGLDHRMDELDKGMVANQVTTIKWVVGIFVGTVVMVSSTVGVYTAILVLVT